MTGEIPVEITPLFLNKFVRHAFLGRWNGAAASNRAIASWSAAVLCRFQMEPHGCHHDHELPCACANAKASEDWRTPKPGGLPCGSGGREASWTAVVLYRFSPRNGMGLRAMSRLSSSSRPLPKRQPPPRRSGALARREGGRTGAVQKLRQFLSGRPSARFPEICNDS